LHANEAEAYISEKLASIKERLRKGELRSGAQGVYVFKIITVFFTIFQYKGRWKTF